MGRTMQRHSVEAIVRALNAAEVRYLIAGGLAVVAHGHVRFTADLDIILAMVKAEVPAADTALTSTAFETRPEGCPCRATYRATSPPPGTTTRP